MEPSVICLGITDAGRCCFDKTAASLAGCCGGSTSSYILHKHRALGHLAGKWIFRKTHQPKKQIGIYDHSCFSKISAAPQWWVFYGQISCDDARRFFNVFSIDFSRLSARFLQDVMNCKREAGLSWNYYGRTVMVAWSYLATVCTLLRTTGPTSAAALTRFYYCVLQNWSLQNWPAHMEAT